MRNSLSQLLNKCPWPIGLGARFPTWTGEFDSRRALFFQFGIANLELPIPHSKLLHGPSVQSGVDATLSRWRSPVQIRYGSLSKKCSANTPEHIFTLCGTPTAERPVSETGACEFESHPYNFSNSEFGMRNEESESLGDPQAQAACL